MEKINGLHNETVNAIRDGLAVPLPEFLNSNPEAREAFSEALQKSHELKKNLDLLTPEERILFIEKFQKALEAEDPNLLAAIARGAAIGVMPTGGLIALGSDNPMFGILSLGAGVVLLLSSLYLDISAKSDKDAIKKLIIESVTG